MSGRRCASFVNFFLSYWRTRSPDPRVRADGVLTVLGREQLVVHHGQAPHDVRDVEVGVLVDAGAVRLEEDELAARIRQVLLEFRPVAVEVAERVERHLLDPLVPKPGMADNAGVPEGAWGAIRA